MILYKNHIKIWFTKKKLKTYERNSNSIKNLCKKMQVWYECWKYINMRSPESVEWETSKKFNFFGITGCGGTKDQEYSRPGDESTGHLCQGFWSPLL